MTLPDFQHRLVDYLVADGPMPDDWIEPRYRHRLSIYRNNVQVGLKHYLADVYPALKALVGDDFFNALCRRVIQTLAPERGNLHDYGDHLPAELARLPGVADRRYLVDTARLEWAYHRAYYADDSAGASLDDLPSLATAALALSPDAAVIRSDYPIDDLWCQSRPDYTGDFTVRLDSGPASVLVHRRPDGVEVRRLTPAATALLDGIDRGLTLEAAIARALTEAGADQLTPFLSYCLHSRLLRRRPNRPLTSSEGQPPVTRSWMNGQHQ